MLFLGSWGMKELLVLLSIVSNFNFPLILLSSSDFSDWLHCASNTAMALCSNNAWLLLTSTQVDDEDLKE